MDAQGFQITGRRELERLKTRHPSTLTDVERAGRFLYLQRTAFGEKMQGPISGSAAAEASPVSCPRTPEPAGSAAAAPATSPAPSSSRRFSPRPGVVGVIAVSRHWTSHLPVSQPCRRRIKELSAMPSNSIVCTRFISGPCRGPEPNSNWIKRKGNVSTGLTCAPQLFCRPPPGELRPRCTNDPLQPHPDRYLTLPRPDLVHDPHQVFVTRELAKFSNRPARRTVP